MVSKTSANIRGLGQRSQSIHRDYEINMCCSYGQCYKFEYATEILLPAHCLCNMQFFYVDMFILLLGSSVPCPGTVRHEKLNKNALNVKVFH